MATEQPSDFPSVVKEEPPEEHPENTSFCYETVNKEEVILEDEVEHADDQPESVSDPQTKISRKRSFECPECNRTFNRLVYRNKCVKRHNAIRLQLYKCKFCGKLSGTSNNHRRHEAIHKKETNELQPVLDSKQDKSDDDPLQKQKCEYSKHVNNHKKDLLPTVAKEEPPEEQPENTSFCYETVTKEEVILEDEVEHADDQPESVSDPQTKISRKRSFECPECNRTFNRLVYRNKCVKRHNAIRLQLYKCKFCGKLSGTSNNHRRHEAIHKKETNELQPVLDSKQDKSDDDPLQKQKCEYFKHVNSHQKDLPTVAKEEPPEEQPENTSFCYETVTKEEVILEDEVEHGDGQPESVSVPQTKISRKRSYECPECNRTFKRLVYRNKCVKRHNAIRLQLYKCKFCAKFFGTLYEQRRHEATHKKGTKKVQPVSDSEQGKSEDDPPQKEDSSKDSIVEKNIENDKSEEPVPSNDGDLAESLTGKMLEENDIFKCSECNRTFDEAEALRRCKKRHQAIKLELYKCKTCGKCEYSKHNLARHVNTHKKEMQQVQLVRNAPLSEGDKRFKCSECNRAFRDLYMATRCEKKHSAVRLGLYECKFCKMRVGTLVDLKRHEQVRHTTKAELVGPKPFVCDKCGMCYAKKETIQKHVCSQEAEEVRFTCHKCYADFPTRQNLLLHIKRHDWNQTKHEYFAKLAKDDKGNHLCTICNQSFINQQTATCHVFRHMNLIEGLLVCKTCGVKCRDNREHRIHMQNHTKPKEVPKTSDENHPSEETDENLSKESDALNETFCNDAMIKEELMEDDELGESAQDEQKEDSRKLLEDHQPRMKQEEEPSGSTKGKKPTQKKFKCDICDKVFGKKYALQKHRKIHEKKSQRSKYEDFMVKGKDGYTCLLCGSTFKKRNTATTDICRHMNVIEGIFKCKICGLRSGKKHEHQLHIKTHKSTSDQRALPRDIEGVHSDYTASSNVACEKSDLPLHCKTCNVFFNNKTNLNVHLWTSKLKFIRMKTAAVEGDGNDTRPS